MSQNTSTRKYRFFSPLIHMIGWCMFFGFPFFFILTRNNQQFNWTDYARHFIVPFSFCFAFYLNYFLLIPKILFKEQFKRYILLNVVLIIFCSIGMQFWQTLFGGQPPRARNDIPPFVVIFMRDVFSLVLTIGLAAAIKLSDKWSKTENARREAEKSRAEAELKNLRNQLNPHFLLNTLNNIYALIAFNADQAQAAVQELSKLLRYVLYDNQQTYVSLGKEMDFIRNYIELMRIRVSSNVHIETLIDISPDNRTPIAPLIFISLIENAFKHGISPTKPSFIRIYFSETDNEVQCDITNSYYPKSQSDKSGSGIGLEQVRKRLELIYPGKYEWRKGVDEVNHTYYSRLTIHANDVYSEIENPTKD